MYIIILDLLTGTDDVKNVVVIQNTDTTTYSINYLSRVLDSFQYLQQKHHSSHLPSHFSTTLESAPCLTSYSWVLNRATAFWPPNYWGTMIQFWQVVRVWAAGVIDIRITTGTNSLTWFLIYGGFSVDMWTTVTHPRIDRGKRYLTFANCLISAEAM